MVKIVDCTIRDGGYLNHWEFQDSFVSELYNCANNSGIEYFEIGYKCKSDTKFASCNDELIKKLIPSSKNCKITVMVEADKFKKEEFKQNSPINVVRIASYPQSLYKAFEQTKLLRDMGYIVFLNLMASSRLTKADVENLNRFNSKSELEAIVISDTFGALTPQKLETLFNDIKTAGYSKLGFHAHNNIGFAFSNTIKAIELGAYTVDATLNGAGRWAGNTNIIELLKNLGLKTDDYKQIWEKYPCIFKKDYGKDDYTKLSAKYNIHPYYVESMKLKYNLSVQKIEEILSKQAETLDIRYNSECELCL